MYIISKKLDNRTNTKFDLMANNDPILRFIYSTQGVCPPEIHFKINKDIIEEVRFVGGGCPGNAQLVARLLKGRPIKDVLNYLDGIGCRNQTSCPDQLARAIISAANGDLKPAASFRTYQDIGHYTKVGLIGELSGNRRTLENLLAQIKAMDVATVYCLGNLTGPSAKNADLIKFFKKNNITAIQGVFDWQLAQSEATDHLPDLAPKDRDWLLRLPQVLNFQMKNKKAIAFFGDYIQGLSGFSDFEPFALEMNMVCGLTNFMQDETVFPALEAMIPQFQTDIIIFSQILQWGHWHVGGKDFISVGPAENRQRMNWGLLTVESEAVHFETVDLSA